MIRYALTCDLEHDFEGWFRNSDDFEAQNAKGLIACPMCGSSDIQKKLMAPAVSTSRAKQALAESHAAGNPQTMPDMAGDVSMPEAGGAGAETDTVQQTALLPQDVRQKEVVEALRTLRKRMVEVSDYVGKDFPEEARRMHYGETEERNIYGESSLDEAKALLEEGIDILPLPILPDEKN